MRMVLGGRNLKEEESRKHLWLSVKGPKMKPQESGQTARGEPSHAQHGLKRSQFLWGCRPTAFSVYSILSSATSKGDGDIMLQCRPKFCFQPVFTLQKSGEKEILAGRVEQRELLGCSGEVAVPPLGDIGWSSVGQMSSVWEG